MKMEPNKFDGWAQKRKERVTIADNPFDSALLGMEIDLRSSYPWGARRLIPRKEADTSDQVFQALLADANRELASLLRDVQAGSPADLRGRGQGQPMPDLLMRAVRCAAKQFMLQAELGSLALLDELTGLYNRRGFMALAKRQLKLGRRSRREIMLLFIDVDGLKQINDSFGHSQGDAALKRAAEVLQRTFRDSDVIARLGGDEFAVLAIEASGHSEATIRARLGEYLNESNSKEARYSIALSLGVARFDHRDSTSIRDLIAQADQAMYEEKRDRSRCGTALRAS